MSSLSQTMIDIDKRLITKGVSNLQETQKEISDMCIKSRKLYYQVQNKEIKLANKTIKDIDAMIYYLEQSKELLNENINRDEEYLSTSDNIHKPKIFLNQRGFGMKVATVYPFLNMAEIKNYALDIVEVTWLKGLIAIILFLVNVIWGTNTLYSALIVISILNLIIKLFENRDSVNIQKYIQFFIMTWIWAAVANQINKAVSIDGVPEGVILSVVIIALILAELKSIIEVSERLGYPVPEILKKISKSSQDNNLDI